MTHTNSPYGSGSGDTLERTRRELLETRRNLKRAELDCSLAAKERKQLLKAIPSILICVSGSEIVTQWNPVSEQVFGIPAGDVLGKPFAECGIGWNREQVREGVVRCLSSRESIRVDNIPFTRNDGYEGILGITLRSIQAGPGERPGFLLLGADITKRLALEARLGQARKLEAVGQLAAGIAHEINTPLQYIGDNVKFLQDGFTDLLNTLSGYEKVLQAARQGQVSGQLIEAAEKSVREADLDFLAEEIPSAILQTLEGLEHVSRIVRSMKDFSHPGSSRKTHVDINKALESTVTVSRSEWKYVADITLDLSESLSQVPGLPGELNQVFLNMITNAAHAIEERTGPDPASKGRITISSRERGNTVIITFTDTGAGMPDHVRARIFDPFFTTKEVGKGTGQGLHISRQVITEMHGGRIDVETRQGQGTTFIITLPCTGSTGEPCS